MFGYVKPFIPNLRVKDYELYKSVYCGLCRSMGNHTGGVSRMTLSYDMTFFALVRLALSGEDYGIRRRRCAVHPIKKRPMMDDNDALAYTSYVSALLVYHKLFDTVEDENGMKRATAKAMMPYAKHLRKKALRAGYREAQEIVSLAMAELSALEKEHCAVPDMPADVFGRMLGDLLAVGLDGSAVLIAREIGLHTGRWVYLTDAVFDYEDDRKKGSYNPFLYAFSDESEMAEFREHTLRGIMTMESDAIARALLLANECVPGLRECIENIIYDGMESALSAVVGKEKNDGE